MKGLVTKSTGSWYSVRTEDGTYYDCRIKGKFRIKGIKSTNPLAVGDWVIFKVESDDNTGVINEILDRKNYIVRRSVNLSKQTHIIGSNIDMAFLVVTMAKPHTSTGFIDRFLVTAEAYNIPTIILFNKTDIYKLEERAEMMMLNDIYTDIGYECIDISAKTGKNIELVKERMKDNISMFSGHSGVGKSTLINSIDSKLNLKTAEVSHSHNKGQHTTTFAEMFELDFGGFIIDTPGIKGFGLVDMPPEEIGDYFPEIFAIKNKCKFNNCLHTNEPKCAVKDAVENEEISATRYLSYLSFIEGDEENYRTDDYA
ncbi:MAG: ribosome small subunit-dependent GTPase A [Flavobacteriales bacterium]|nr:ribosome small subunit-dependent GTPase A [Flavobacteriales bacterium]